MLHEELTGTVLAAARVLYNAVGNGFSEKTYHRGMILELTARGVFPDPTSTFKIYFRGQPIGTYHADLVVNQLVVVELKSVEAMNKIHESQILNYLRASKKEVGLLINFGADRLQVKRYINTSGGVQVIAGTHGNDTGTR